MDESAAGRKTLSPRERLLRAPDFTRVFRRGRCFRDRVMRIHCLESRMDRSRLGLVVSRKVGNAVVRNRVKRRLRSVFQGRKSTLPATLDIVVVASPKHGEGTFEEYARAFEKFIDWYREGPRRQRSRR